MNPDYSLADWVSNRGTLKRLPKLNLSLARFSGFGSLRGPVMAGNSGSFCTPQTEVSGSSELPVVGFLSPSGFGSGRSAAVFAHRAVNVSGGWSASALCGRTWL